MSPGKSTACSFGEWASWHMGATPCESELVAGLDCHGTHVFVISLAM